ncbi:MAG TPA: TRAP transporter large permease subunit, partial [Smithellaceae bacterium]|nr:TRAP transporter large permease subunit [Smithellaceae bacterium]
MFNIDPITITVLMFCGLLVGLFLGHSLAFVFGGLAVIFGYLTWGPGCFPLFSNRIVGLMDNFILVAIPMFILMANLLNSSGVADGLFDSLRYLMGPIRGGIALAVVIVCTLFAACTGVIAASIVSMGLLGLPIMLKYGYDKQLACGTICAGGSLGILIPPSIMLVVMADMTGLSVGKLFVGSVVPGVMLAALYAVYILLICWFKPQMGPPLSKEERAKVSTPQVLKMCLISLVPPLILILGVLGSIFTGVATPTEASGVGAFLALLMTIAYGKFSWKMMEEVTLSTAKTVAMVMMILVGATCFTGIFMGTGGGNAVANALLNLGLGKWGTFIIMHLIIFILGMFLDWIGIVYLTFPIFIPVVQQLGFDPLWFVVMTAVNLQSSFLTPPFGYALFFMKGIAAKDLSTAQIYRSVIPFVILIVLGMALCIIFPELITAPANFVD